MVHKILVRIVAALTLVFMQVSASADGQQKLTNQDVVKMVKAGLSPEIIKQAINSNPNQFDLSADGLILLKQGGVSDDVIQAMVARTGGSSNNAVPAPGKADDSSAISSGVILMILGLIAIGE